MKLGPTTTPDDALALAAKLNPDNEAGRLTFITRFGAGKIRDGLPQLIEKVTAAGVAGRLGLRPDARQHLRGELGLQDPPLRRRDRRGPGLLRRAPLARHLARRPARRAHRRRRHRVRRRRRGAHRPRPRAPLRVGLRPAAQPGAVAGAGVPRRRDAARARHDRPPLATPSPDPPRRCGPRWRAPRSATTCTARTRPSRALEERVAGLFGHEAALFTPTGSMANVLAVRSLVAPGQEVLCEASAHIARAELGAHGAYSGVTMRTWIHPRGQVDLPTIRTIFAPDMGPFFVPHGGDLGREHPQLRRRRGAAAAGPARPARVRHRGRRRASTSTAPGSGTPTSPPASRSRSTARSPTCWPSACPRGSAPRSAR